MSDQITLNFGTGWSCDSVTGSAVRDVTTEREKQIDKGYTPEHDEFHGVIHLWSEAHRRLVELNLTDDTESRQSFIEVAAISIAAVETIDRARAAASADAAPGGDQ